MICKTVLVKSMVIFLANYACACETTVLKVTARSVTIFKKALERRHHPILNAIRAYKVEFRNVNLAFRHLCNKD